jgi:hypothetical protein
MEMTKSKNLSIHAVPLIVLSVGMLVILIVGVNLMGASKLKATSSLNPLLDSKIFSIKSSDNGTIKVSRYESESVGIPNTKSSFSGVSSLGMYTVANAVNIVPVNN